MTDWYYAENGLNVQLTLFFYRLGNFGLDGLFRFLEAAGRHHAFPYFFALLVGIGCWHLVKLKKLQALNRMWILYYAIFYISLVASLYIEGTFVDNLKEQFAHARPYIAFPDLITPIMGKQPDFQAYRSFPSGHAAFTGFIVAASWPLLANFLKLPAILYVLLMMWFRLAAGVHFAADVIVGAFIGAMLGTFLPMAIRILLHKCFKIPLSLDAKP